MAKTIVKEVELTNEQIEVFQRIEETYREVQKTVARILNELGALMARNKRDAWNEIAQLLGYDSSNAVYSDGLHMEVNYLRRCARLLRDEEGTGECDAEETET